MTKKTLPITLASTLGVGLLCVPAGIALAHPLPPGMPASAAPIVAQANTEAAADAAEAAGNHTAAIGIFDILIRDAPKKFTYYLKRGISEFGAGQFEKSAADFSKFIELRPALIEGYLNRAYAYEKLGKGTEGLADLAKVESLDASSMDYRLKGNLQRQKKDYAGATASYTKVPGALGQFLAGDVYADQNKYAEAIEAYTKGITAAPKDVYGYQQRAAAYIASKKYDLGIKDLTQYITLAPNDSAGYLQRGFANVNLGTPAGYTAAKADLQKALAQEKDPAQKLVIIRLLAVAQKESGDSKDAADSYSKVIAANNKDDNALFSRGMVYMSLKDYPNAIKDFKTYATVFASGSEAGNAAYNLGQAYLLTKDYEGAIPAFTSALRVDPKDMGAYHGRLVAEYVTKQYDKAVTDADQVYATAKNPKDEKVVDAYRLQALSYGELAKAPGDPNAQKALSTAEKYVALVPGDQRAIDIQTDLVAKWANADAQIATYTKNIAATKDSKKLFDLYLNRGITYSQQKANDKAIADYTKASTLNPSDKDVFRFLATAQGEKGDTAGAIASYTKAIALSPDKTDLLTSRALMYIDAKNYAKADADLSAYAAKAGNAADPAAIQIQAQIKRELGKQDEAIALFQKHLAVEKEEAPRLASQLELGQLYLNKKDFASAIKTYSDYLDKKKDVAAHVARADAYRLSNDTGKAMEDANAAVTLAPANPVALTARAFVYNLVGEREDKDPDKAAAAWDAAIADCDKAIAADAKYNRAYYCKGFAAYNNASTKGKADPGYEKVALAAFNQFIATAPAGDALLTQVKGAIADLKERGG